MTRAEELVCALRDALASRRDHLVLVGLQCKCVREGARLWCADYLTGDRIPLGKITDAEVPDSAVALLAEMKHWRKAAKKTPAAMRSKAEWHAKKLVSKPLRFGDPEQVEAIRYLSLFERAKALGLETVCQRCKGSGHVICSQCGGSAVRTLEHCDAQELEELLETRIGWKSFNA